jgi:tRNA-specific 2-thiouridylase
MDRELFEHYFEDETRLGPAVDGAFTGAAGGAACGDYARVSLTVDDGRIGSVSFDTEGCGATRAATAAVAEMVDGATPLEAARISIDDVADSLGGLIPSKRHAAQLAADALHRALQGAAASSLPLVPPEGGVF